MYKYILGGIVLIGFGVSLYYLYQARKRIRELEEMQREVAEQIKLFQDMQNVPLPRMTMQPVQPPAPVSAPVPAPEPPQGPALDYGSIIHQITGGTGLSGIIHNIQASFGGVAQDVPMESLFATEQVTITEQPAPEAVAEELIDAFNANSEATEASPERSEASETSAPAQPLSQSVLEKMLATDLLKLAKKHGIDPKKKNDKGKPVSKKRAELIKDLSFLCNANEEINVVQ